MKKFLLAILLIPSFLRAMDIDKTNSLELLNDWSGGLNTQYSSHKMPKNMSPNMQNVLIDEVPGSIVKRNGYIISGGTPSAMTSIVSMYQFVKNNGDKEMLVSDSSRTFSTKDFVSYVVVKNTQTTTAVLRCAQGRGKIWCTNGADPVFTWDGTNAVPLDGTNGAPNVPRGQFITFYLDRFWVANTTTNNSALHFSALSSTDGFALAPDDIRAWPTINQLNIALGDGIPISALDIFKGQLLVHKYNSAIHTIYGTDEFTFFARKTNAHTGTISQESIGQVDNKEYYIAREGVYAFDSLNSERISDLIKPDIDAIAETITSIRNNTWDTQSDFITGGSFFNTTATISGNITMLTSSATLNNLDTSLTIGTDYQFISATHTNTGYLIFKPTITISSDFVGEFSTMSLWVRRVSGSGNIGMAFRNENNSKIVTCPNVPAPAISPSFSKVDFICSADSDAVWSQSELSNSSFSIIVQCQNQSCVDLQFYFYPATITGYANLWMQSVTTGEYISQITTVTPITYWDKFSAVTNSNGGNVYFYVKGATSAVNIGTETWTTVTAGSLITLPVAKNFIQWATTIAATSYATPSNVDSVTIGHNEGISSTNRPVAFTWKQRYILAVSTIIGSNTTIFYVKSKSSNSTPNAWMKYMGINARPMIRFGDNFQAGSSTSGTILRLDYGTNDAGSIIDAFYDTPDLDFSKPMFEKNVTEYILDSEQYANSNLLLGTSVNRSAYSTSTISLDGSGTLLRNFYGVNAGGRTHGKLWRFRFENNELDMPFKFNTFGIIYKPTEIRDND